VQDGRRDGTDDDAPGPSRVHRMSLRVLRKNQTP
jgi:hypothetical protein